MQFSTIQARVAEYLDRADLTTEIQAWINDTRKSIAIEALAASHTFNYLYTEATIETSAGSATYALPSDYLGRLTIMLESKKLHHVDAREFDEGNSPDATKQANNYLLVTTNENTGSGEPDYYVDRGMEIELFPNPSGTYTVTLKYYAQPADFTGNTDEDYLCRFHPDAVVFGTVIRGAAYLDDQVKLQIFSPLFEKEMKKISYKEKMNEKADSTVRMRTYKDFNLTTFLKKYRMVS
jgi:hypothetical protein